VPIPQETDGGPKGTRRPLTKSLVIPRLNAEAVGLFHRRLPAKRRSDSYSETKQNYYTGAEFTFYEDNTFTTVVGSMRRYYGTHAGSPSYDGSSFLATGAVNTGLSLLESLAPGVYSNACFPGDMTASYTDENDYEHSYVLYTSSAAIDLGGEANDDWYLYLNSDVDADYVSFQAQASAAGHIIYPKKCDAFEWSVLPEYNSDANALVASGTRCRWIGWE